MLGFAGANGIDFENHAEESYNLPNEAGKSALVAKVSAVFLCVFLLIAAAVGAIAVLIVVTFGFDYFLLNKYGVANRAMFALGKTVFGAGRCNCFVSNLGVTFSFDYFLLDKNSVANRAMLSFGQAVLGAGCGNGLVGNFVVTVCRAVFKGGCAGFAASARVVVYGFFGAGRRTLEVF